jgi:hypothetical protein
MVFNLTKGNVHLERMVKTKSVQLDFSETKPNSSQVLLQNSTIEALRELSWNPSSNGKTFDELILDLIKLRKQA